MSTRRLQIKRVIIPEHVHRLTISEDAIHDLADSISKHGLINPITVTDNGDETYTLRAGHCRLLAHQHLGLDTIDATIRTGSERDTEGITFAENLHRTQLSPMEEAYAIKHEHEVNIVPIETIARTLHRSKDWVLQRLALVEMPPDLCELVHNRELTLGCALALAQVTDDEHRRYLQNYAISAGASVAVIREWVYQWQLARDLGTPDGAPRPDMPLDGESIVITMPCHGCGDAHPYQNLLVMRMCRDCFYAMENSVHQPEPQPA